MKKLLGTLLGAALLISPAVAQEGVRPCYDMEQVKQINEKNGIIWVWEGQAYKDQDTTARSVLGLNPDGTHWVFGAIINDDAVFCPLAGGRIWTYTKPKPAEKIN